MRMPNSLTVTALLLLYRILPIMEINLKHNFEGFSLSKKEGGEPMEDGECGIPLLQPLSVPFFLRSESPSFLLYPIKEGWRQKVLSTCTLSHSAHGIANLWRTHQQVDYG